MRDQAVLAVDRRGVDVLPERAVKDGRGALQLASTWSQ